MLPIGSVSSRGLELLLRRYTLPVRQLPSFDVLPIPFRAVATDMESGEAVIFRAGDLAQALRASMSVPGVFPPTEVDHRILGDGGLVNNLPVDVVRAMGVDLVIAVNIGTPLAGRDSLGTVLGLTSQMVNILTEQNVQRSIATLDPAHDLLIAPPLGRLTSGDFDRAADLIAAGEQHTVRMLPQLAALRLNEVDWQAMRLAQARPEDPPQPITSVRFEGQDITTPERLRGVLAVQPGQPFSVERAERDSRTLAASGDYLHVDYRVEDLPAGTGLVYRVEEKPLGAALFPARTGHGRAISLAGATSTSSSATTATGSTTAAPSGATGSSSARCRAGSASCTCRWGRAADRPATGFLAGLGRGRAPPPDHLPAAGA